jgi:BirA family biotin operon repressor/biotin-[acetyl-CoA-carboxylase] ligase
VDTPWTDLDRPPLREAALRAALTDGDGGARAWRALELVASTGSTNADVAARARAGEPEGLVLVADHQDAGRGRLDRGWVAPPRSSLSVSVLLRPGAAGVPPQRLSWLPLLAGLAVVDALTRRCGLAARLKWPNDVLVPAGGVPAGEGPELRKICGILAELVPAADGSISICPPIAWARCFMLARPCPVRSPAKPWPLSFTRT